MQQLAGDSCLCLQVRGVTCRQPSRTKVETQTGVQLGTGTQCGPVGVVLVVASEQWVEQVGVTVGSAAHTRLGGAGEQEVRPADGGRAKAYGARAAMGSCRWSSRRRVSVGRVRVNDECECVRCGGGRAGSLQVGETLVAVVVVLGRWCWRWSVRGSRMDDYSYYSWTLPVFDRTRCIHAACGLSLAGVRGQTGRQRTERVERRRSEPVCAGQASRAAHEASPY